ncbi:unnamed protein product [Closterium sp. Naga37s-1]|nr:unnamed protein product [Closterium sp. Naga37s-1]
MELGSEVGRKQGGSDGRVVFEERLAPAHAASESNALTTPSRRVACRSHAAADVEEGAQQADLRSPLLSVGGSAGPKERHHHHSNSIGGGAGPSPGGGGSSASEGKLASFFRADSASERKRDDNWAVGASGGGRRSRRFQVAGSALVSGMCYCASSCSMILLNKVVLSAPCIMLASILLRRSLPSPPLLSFSPPSLPSAPVHRLLTHPPLPVHTAHNPTIPYGYGFVRALQNLVSVTVVLVLVYMGVIATEPLTLRLMTVWLPVNLIFVGMLVTSFFRCSPSFRCPVCFFSLQYMQVAMVTILKNVTNLITAVGEMYLFRKRHSSKVWGSLFLMILSAFCGGFTDLAFHPVGYTWQIFNCFFTAAYSLTLRRVMDSAKAATKSGQLSEFTMVLLNNALSFPPAILLIIAFSETKYLLHSPLMLNGGFWVAVTLSGLLGLAISFTSMWFLHQTSPTTYSLVGSLNKIPLSLFGIILFNAPTNAANISSILFVHRPPPSPLHPLGCVPH